MATCLAGRVMADEVEDDWLAILLGQQPAVMPAEASLSEGLAARARSRSRDQAGSFRAPPPPVNPQLCQTALAEASVGCQLESGTEEAEWLHLPLNIIESNPDDEEAFVERQRRANAIAKLAQEQTANKRDAAVQLSRTAVQQSSWSRAAAAASRACAQAFGNSNSVFHHGAMMSYFLKGSVYSDSAASSLAENLPEQLRGLAMAQLRELAQNPAVQLFPTSFSLVAEVEARVVHELSVKPEAEFYIGISERPRARLAEHQANGYKSFWLYIFPSSQQSGGAEVALINVLKARHQCLNIGTGNERASSGQPHYLYIAWRPAGSGIIRRAPTL